MTPPKPAFLLRGTEMRFSKRDDIYQVSRITGPAHNLLRLELGTEGEAADPVVEALELDRAAPATGLDPDVIRKEVLAGIATANIGSSGRHAVRKIQYVKSDTPSEGVYELLARSIVERIAARGDFNPLK